MSETDFQNFVNTQPGASMFSTAELRQAFSMKQELENPEFDTFVRQTRGINIVTRNKMLRAFDADDAGTRLDELINHSPENYIRPEIRAELNRQWSKNFNESSRFKG
ncbi:MAG: hypothetical protein H9W81_13440 [Enterococcus sp.]|nr:hypothetical protein [Enterococcus sp.]